MAFVIALLPNNLVVAEFTAHCRNYQPKFFYEGGTCVGAVPDLVNDI
ncbi:hypothetical protein [Psychrosphaera algicola]|uniref:Uncharacterized protein n=1 Tax=Psychrosphaera algicola TaxID=3023714 RepID=A0ABT5F9D8_9GAMM|nr:hypothetical protein [Psychrosphaera sp. G1-22]MDC2888130.1 hypothetical protein [Psychrosphaera sp. G1-22]